MERVSFIINPVAGRRNGERLARFIRKISAGTSLTPVISLTEGKGNAKNIVRQGLDEGILKFVAVGGDGTVNEVASQLIHTEGILGIIPTGSGNGLARHLGYPVRVRGALKVIEAGNVIEMDYGLMDNQPFFCVGGVGFDAAIGHLFAERSGRGLPAYAMAALNEYFRYEPVKYSLKIDGKRKIKRRAFLVSFANSSQYGNNAFISPGADVADGLIDVCILRPFHVVRSLKIVYDLFGKKLDRSGSLEIIRCREVQLKRKKPGYIHYDGEPGKAGKKIRIRLREGGLRVIVP